MKFRPAVVLAAVLTTVVVQLSGIVPAGAATTDTVTNLAVSQAQVGQSLQLTATWTANPEATTYRAYLTDQADGAGAVLAFQDTSTTSATISTSSLATGQQYWMAVKAIAPDSGTVTTVGFTADPLDTTGPTGTFSLNRTSGYLTSADFLTAPSAAFRITQTALSDDTTPAAAISRTVRPGDGTATKTWSTGTTFPLTYTKTGTFTPHVFLTDEFGNRTDVALPTVTVKNDTTAPRVRITLPANSGRIASWQRIKGTATDAGTGVFAALSMVIERRGGTWYAYDFAHRKWLKGYSTITKTLNRTKAEPAFMHVTSAGTWRSPAIRGLRRGPLHVEAVGIDNAFNVGFAPVVNRRIH